MKLKRMVWPVLAGVFAAVLACLWFAHGGRAVPATPFIALSSVSVPEMPAKAADLVSGAPVLERANTAAAVLRAVTTMARPGVLPYVVSAICRRNPEVSGTVVATAIQLQPDDERAFCLAAVCAAPDRVEEVVTSACEAAPGYFADAALVAFERWPADDHLILDGLTNALPVLKPYLDQAARQNGTNDFPTLINRTVQLVQDATKTETGK